MPFTIKKFLDHGTENPIVARLSLQTFQILDKCNVTKEFRDKVADIYFDSLQRKLLRCWEIEQRFLEQFDAALAAFQPNSRGQAINVPQVDRLDEESHNFLYEAKNYIRDLLQVLNKLYDTDFKEAGEFYLGKKGGLSVVEWAEKNFGHDDPKTQSFQETIVTVEKIVRARNAVEHPGGYSGTLRIENFTLSADGQLREPIWYREKDGEYVEAPTSIRQDMGAGIYNLLLLGEEVVAIWAQDRFREAGLMQVAMLPREQRDPKCPVKYVVTVGPELARRIQEGGQDNDQRG